MPDGWREVTRRDSHYLQSWICTDPSKATYRHGTGQQHPRPWELEVQSYFRNKECFQIGTVWGFFDEEGPLALAHTSFDSQDTTAFIHAVGRAQRARGGGLGDSAMTLCLNIAAEQGATAIAGNVHPRNVASQAMFERNGYSRAEVQADGLELWVRLLAL